MKVVVISPHPDDLEISCAGTLLKLKEQGHDVVSIITVKPSEEYNPNRNSSKVFEELSKSYKISGFELLILDTDLHDNGRPNLKVDNVTMSKLSELIPECDLAIIPHIMDSHQDHKNTYNLSLPLLIKKSPKIWLMHNPLYSLYYDNSCVNLTRDITDFWEIKKKLINCYDSYFNDKLIDQIYTFNKHWGFKNNTELAEAFTVILDRE